MCNKDLKPSLHVKNKTGRFFQGLPRAALATATKLVGGSACTLHRLIAPCMLLNIDFPCGSNLLVITLTLFMLFTSGLYIYFLCFTGTLKHASSHCILECFSFCSVFFPHRFLDFRCVNVQHVVRHILRPDFHLSFQLYYFCLIFKCLSKMFHGCVYFPAELLQFAQNYMPQPQCASVFCAIY